MTVWLVRAGSHGECEDLALGQGLSVIAWAELPDLTAVASKDELEALMRETYPDASDGRIRNNTAQVWAFRDGIKVGDLVTLPLKHQPAIAIGEITGPYRFRRDLPSDARHVRTTEWLETAVPRIAFGQDLLYTLGAFRTVCRVERNNAEQRIEEILAARAPWRAPRGAAAGEVTG